jgi:molecular chaperone GrpE
VTPSRRIPIEGEAAEADPETPGPETPAEDETPAQVEEHGLEEVPGTSEPGLEEELDALRTERDALRDAVLRRRADFENYRKRVERDRHTAAQEALAAVFREVVGTVDNLERALSAGGGSSEELREGVQLTYRELLGLLESHDVVAIDPAAGDAFDPTVHQALLHEPVRGFPEGSVAEVLRKGYTFGERLLRPALVKVAKSDGDEEEAPDENEAS